MTHWLIICTWLNTGVNMVHCLQFTAMHSTALALALLVFLSVTFGFVYTLGTNDFQKILGTKNFVDKTLLIKELFTQSSAIRGVLITAPPGFGKSTNMDMIKRFFEVQLDDDSNKVVNVKTTETYKMFANNSLEIYKEEDFFEEHFGKYPLIFVDFNSLQFESFETFLKGFKDVLTKIFWSHRYLLESMFISDSEKEEFRVYSDEILIGKHEKKMFDVCLPFICRLLHAHFKKRVVILIDHFDRPVQDAIFRSSSEFEKAEYHIKLFTSNLLKSDYNVEIVLLNACIYLPLMINKDKNKILWVPFLSDSEFSRFYGLTEDEVKVLLEKYNMTDKFEQVTQWYNGYEVEKSRVKRYNVLSVIAYLRHKVLRDYLVQSSSIRKLYNIMSRKKVRQRMDSFFHKRKMIIPIQRINTIQIHRLGKMNEYDNKDLLLYDEDVDLILQLLAEMGYFNVIRRGLHDMTINIPNEEIKHEFSRLISK